MNKAQVMPQSCGVIVIPDLIGNPEKSMLDSRFRGNDSIEVRNLPTRLRGYQQMTRAAVGCRPARRVKFERFRRDFQVVKKT
jgi:hypothetical protein